MTPTAKRRRVPITVYFEPAQLEALTKLSKRTRVPKAVYVRVALDRLLNRHRKAAPCCENLVEISEFSLTKRRKP